jgi:small-conductance mechanosensitive channel
VQALLEQASTYLWDNPWGRSFTIFTGSFFVAWLTEILVCRSLAGIAGKTDTELDDQIVAAIRRPIFVSVLFYGIYWALEHHNLGSGATYAIHGSLKTGAVILWAGVVFKVGGLFLQALSSHGESDSILQQRTLPIFNMLLKGVSFAMAIYFLFLSWDIDVTAWLASAGIIGIAVGFAAQDTLANLFAGIFIIADAPYRIGDFIVLDDGVRGKVTRIGMRSTRILTLDDVEVTVPNKVIGGSKIINEAGGPSLKQRVKVSVEAAYGSDVEEVRKALLECTEGIDGISRRPKPTTKFKSFGASGLVFELLVWVSEPSKREAILDVLHERVYNAFHKANLEIPYSKQDLYIKEMPAKGVGPRA